MAPITCIVIRGRFLPRLQVVAALVVEDDIQPFGLFVTGDPQAHQSQNRPLKQILSLTMSLTATDGKETNTITGHWELKGVDGRGHPSHPLI